MLPPGWARISLTSPRERGLAVRGIVATQFAGTPANPALRSQTTAALMRVTADAAKAGATILAIHLLAPHGVPIPITLTVFRPAAPSSMAALKATLAGAADVVEAPMEDGGPVVRRTSRVATTTEGASAPLPQLQAEYWLDPRDGAGLFHAIFTTPLLEQADALVEMFDAIISTVRSLDHDAPEETDADTDAGATPDAQRATA